MKLGTPTLKLLALLLVVGWLAGCSTSPDKRILQYLNQEGFGKRYTGNPEEANYISLGDQISITDLYHPELSVAQGVDIDGTVVLPEIGAVHVAGMTRTELEAFLMEKYSPYYEELDIKARFVAGGKSYFTYGEVGREGQTPFPGDLTIFEAVMNAVPNTSRANLGRVRLIRADPVDPMVISVNVTEMIRTGDSTFNVHVQENDIVYVPGTMLAQFGNFLSALIAPFTQVLGELSSALMGWNRIENWDEQGYGRGRRRY